MTETLPEYLQTLNAPQREAVMADARHLLVLAGAGSGKTRVLVHRIAWLMASRQAMPHQIMAVTFTNKAASEMRHRIQHLIEFSASMIWVGTFHGLSHRILRQHAEKANLPENFQIMDGEDQLRLVKRLLREEKWDEKEVEPRRVVNFINRQKDEGHRPNDITPAFPDVEKYLFIYTLYEQHCQRTGIVDFAELLLRVVELMRQHPDILAEYQTRFQHILVDEFQDTNTIQYRWLQMLGAKSHLTIVGDDDQSIYGWRGAKIENIHRFHQDYPGTVTVRLEQNYRSTNTILAAANALIANNEGRLGKELWTQGLEGERITLYGAFNEIDEARFIVEQLETRLNNGGRCEEVAILYRSNAQSRVLEQTLQHASIPYRIYGGLRFFDRAEIKDVLAYLRLVVNRHDDTAFERVVNLPPRGVGERTLANIRLAAKQQQTSLWQAAMNLLPTLNAGRIQNGLRQFFDCFEQMLGDVSELTLSKLIEQVLEKSGLFTYVKTQPGEKTQGRVENLHELVQAGKQFHQSYEDMFEKQCDNSLETLPSFLSEVALDAGTREGEADTTVKLMTLHSAKGLEFPLVFVAGLEDGLFPHNRCIQNRAALEEERRLCYVGITRAMRKLYMTYAQKRAFAGLSGVSRPSRFIDEIPANLIQCMNINQEAVPAVFNKIDPDLETDCPYTLGQRVRHPRFGEGVIIGGDGQGESARVQVNFGHNGKKWLVLTYAKLEPIA